MLTLRNIVKDYDVGDTQIHALRGVSVDFREHEFVSILGQSGCGKTTLLNIIGGLDGYTSGDLIISGRSTKEFKDADWDTYRNHSIGFVFQSYNLIPHQTVLSNVELALTLSGVSKAERRKRAVEALEKVGLGDQLHKKPNQMSGGQMQRVAIARALVNDPEILLADEPTGALDSETSVQIMEILKEISKDKLIIMVTHNPELAKAYSTRIIRLLDGQITDDSAPYEATEEARQAARNEKFKKHKTSMSFLTALSLSKNNLMTKRGRTFLTSFAGSIGIIGIALILSISSGVQAYIDRVQEDTLSSYPLTLQAETVDMSGLMSSLMESKATESDTGDNDREEDRIYTSSVMYDMVNSLNSVETSKNNLRAFRQYMESNEELKSVLSSVQYSYDVDINIYAKDPDGKVISCDAESLMEDMMASIYGVNASQISSYSMYSSFSTMEIWQEMLPGDNGELVSELMEKQYDVLYGHWPEAYNEVVLIVTEQNEVSDFTLYTLGLKRASDMEEATKAALNQEQLDTSKLESWSFEEICAKDYRLLLSADLYQKNGDGTYTDLSATDTGLDYLYNSENAVPIKIVGIVRPGKDAVSSSMQSGIGYTSALTSYVITAASDTALVKEQLAAPETDVISGLPFPSDTEEALSDSEKAEKIKTYFATLGNAEKAALYTEIVATPTEDYLAQTTAQYLSAMDRATLEAQMIDAYAQQMGIDDTSSVAEYIAQMDDETLFGYAEQSIREQITAQYAAEVEAQLGSMTTDALAAMLDNTPYTEAEYAGFYDRYMPELVSDSTYDDNLKKIGYFDAESPSAIYLYVSTFEDKDTVAEIIDAYNDAADEDDVIEYTDYVALLMSSITTVINAISYVLIAFVAISLVVSSIMIGIITYISVLERTKEIGILRAIGASKRDISRVFNAETLIIGFCSGAIGIGVTLLLLIPINAIIHALTDIMILNAQLPVAGGVTLVLISMFLTFIAGLVPSGLAAKKDPVIALRTE